jgi:hypothetical protein
MRLFLGHLAWLRTGTNMALEESVKHEKVYLFHVTI